MTVAQAGAKGGRASHGGGRPRAAPAPAAAPRAPRRRAPAAPRTVRQQVNQIERRVMAGQENEGDAIADLEALARKGARSAPRSKPKSVPKRTPVSRAHRPAINADFRKQKADILRAFHAGVLMLKQRMAGEKQDLLHRHQSHPMTRATYQKKYDKIERDYARDYGRLERQRDSLLRQIGVRVNG